MAVTVHKDEEEVCACNQTEKPTIFGKSFWDLWLQKLFRNVASVKYQWLVFMYIPVIYGMLYKGLWFTPTDGGAPQWVSAIDPVTGLSFLGGGFVTLATSRIIARTKLTEPPNGDLDTDK